jgi:hypothetical protein
MAGLIISPLRGLSSLWMTLAYNLDIPSGLKKKYQITNHVNKEAICHFGLKFFFDGHLIKHTI